MILDIRAEAYSIKNKDIYQKADLIHNIPYAYRIDKTKSESEKLQSSFDWFSLHLEYEGPHQEYVKTIVERVLSEDL